MIFFDALQKDNIVKGDAHIKTMFDAEETNENVSMRLLCLRVCIAAAQNFLYARQVPIMTSNVQLVI